MTMNVDGEWNRFRRAVLTGFAFGTLSLSIGGGAQAAEMAGALPGCVLSSAPACG